MSEDKFGHCIICHQDNVPLSDEHVIPESIGGFYHIFSVCKKCNTQMGDHVDNHLLNHWFIKAARNENKLKGYSGTIPNPLVGDGILSTGEKVRVELDDKGRLKVHLLPSSPIASDNGKSFKISVDVEDEKLISQIENKLVKRNNIDKSKCAIVSQIEHHKIEHPEVRMQFKIDMQSYKIGILKIAYEFAVDKIPGYYDDPIAHLYSKILHEGNTDRLNEVFFEGDAIINANQTILDDFVDYSKKNRHVLFLFNNQERLYCIVKLFNTTFCQCIKMSDRAYGSDIVLAINDFDKKDCQFYSITEIINKTIKSESTTFKFSNEAENLIQIEINKKGQVGFTCDSKNDNILFNINGVAICTESTLLATLEALNLKRQEPTNLCAISSTYLVPPGFYYRLMPANKLLAIKEITKVNEIKKL